MNLKPFAGHTLDADRLPPGSLVLDVGCHGWDFTQAMLNYGCRVLALDPTPQTEIPDGVEFYEAALVHPLFVGQQKLAQVRDRDGWHLVLPNTPNVNRATEVPVECVSLDQLPGPFAAIKLNCEGAESGILQAIDRVVADQIVVSFHCHTNAQTQEDCDSVIDGLRLFYDVVQHEWTERWGHMNYWDTVLVAK